MRRVVCIASSLLIFDLATGVARADENIALDAYTCAQFLQDAKDPEGGLGVLRSLMMISWAAGYAAAHDAGAPRADPKAVQLIAATLGEACRKSPEQKAMQATTDMISQLASGQTLSKNSVVAQVRAVPIRAGGFNTYDNFDMNKGDLRSTLKKIELNKCVASCEAEKSCQAYSFDKWNKWCYLKSSVSTLALEPSATTGIKKNAAEPPKSGASIRIDLRGAKLFEGKSRNATAKSPDACEQTCEQDGQCLGFTFSKREQACRLFDDISTFSSDTDSISGIKTQYPP
jgi:hypothetical protein